MQYWINRKLETKCIAKKAMQYRQEVMSDISSRILLQAVAKTQEISKKSHFKIGHYVMPSPGGMIEKFYMCA